MCEWNETFDENEDIDVEQDVLEPEKFESSFVYHARPLDQIETIGEDGLIYSLKELEQLKDLKEELGE